MNQELETIWRFVSIIIGPLIGAYVGVKYGFNKNNKHRQELEEKRKLFFKNWLKHEADESIRLVEEGSVNLIPEDAWNSAVNSGNVAFFEAKAMELSDTYFKIKNYNYEAKRVRDATEEVNLHPDVTDPTHAAKLKKRFDEIIKPDTLEALKGIASWLTVFKVESGEFKLTGGDVNLIHADKNGKVIPPEDEKK
jgi:hypothetical protein